MLVDFLVESLRIPQGCGLERETTATFIRRLGNEWFFKRRNPCAPGVREEAMRFFSENFTRFRCAMRWLAVLLFVVLAARLFLFVHRKAVNVLFGDQWDFYVPMFQGEGIWALFSRQHGPHRQGLGMLITAGLAHLSDWNSRWDSFAVAITMVVAAGLAVRLAVKCGLGFAVSTVFCSILFLNLRQYEIFVVTPNISHGALPVVLLLCACLAWFVRSAWLRVAFLALLSFFLIFTGFGLFGGLVIPAVLIGGSVGEFIHRRQVAVLPVTLGLLAIGGAWFLFSRGYVFSPAVADFRFPHERPWEYLPFAGLVLSNAVGVPGSAVVAITVGLLMLGALVLACFVHAVMLLLPRNPDDRPRLMAILTLTGFTLAFVANTAIGRICLGLEGAAAPRYVPLVAPGILGLFLCLRYLSPRRQAVAAVTAILMLAAGLLNISKPAATHARLSADQRKAWCRAYIESRDPVVASRVSGYLVYPDPEAIRGRLELLQSRQLGFLRSSGPKPPAETLP
jgi:hypothetical protein